MSVDPIVGAITRHFPDVQAVYLFGTDRTADQRPDSDVDIALLLPVQRAKKAGNLALDPCGSELCSMLSKEVDLINLRLVDTVFQNEILNTARELLITDRGAADEFAMIALSLYQKLNEERAEIMREILRTGRVYDA